MSFYGAYKYKVKKFNGYLTNNNVVFFMKFKYCSSYFLLFFLKSRILMSVVGFNMHKYTVYSIYAGKHKIIYQSLQMFLKVREGEGALDQEDYSKGEREEDEEGDRAKGKEEK